MRWDTSLYDGRHSFVTQYGEELLTLLKPERGERILDIGCGTGHLTAQIAAAGAIVTGLDHSEEMLEVARRNYPELRFVQADAAQFTLEQSFDAVFSNAALHWVHRAEDAVRCMSRALRTDGRFVVEFGGHGNVRQICSALEHALVELLGKSITVENYFPSIAQYSSLLEKYGIEVSFATLFDRPTRLDDGADGLANWIRMFRRGVLDELTADQQRQLIDAVEDRLRPSQYRDHAWYADYRRLRIVGQKLSTSI